MRRMGIGLGVGINRSNYAQGIFGAYATRVVADGGVVEGGACVDAVSSLLQSASLLLIPSGYKGGKLYAEIPTNGNGDLTWTRGSDAFRTNASGLIQRVPWNLYPNSNTFSSWVKAGVTSSITANSGISPDGTNNAWYFSAISGVKNLRQDIALIGGTVYTITLYVKSYGLGNNTFRLGDGGSASTLTTVTATSDWQRASYTFTCASTGTRSVGIFQDASDSAIDVLIYGAQLVEGTTAQTYLPTTDRLNFPRLDYTYGSCPSALLEPQRTNLATWSEDFSNVVWGKTAATITSNTTTSPDGSTNADTLTADGTSNNHRVELSGSVTSGTLYTVSIYAKKGSNDFLQIFGFGSPFGVNVWANFNLNTGIVGSVGSSTTASIQSIGNGWYRCIITGTASTTGSFALIGYSIVASATSVRAEANTLSTSVFLYGAQLEAGAYPTTYIPTTSATATRVADSFSRNNIYTNGLISASGGTWFVELRNTIPYIRDTFAQSLFIGGNSTGVGGDGFAFTFGGSTANRPLIRKYVGAVESLVGTLTSDNSKVAIKWNGSTADVFINGTKVTSATSFAFTNLQFVGGVGSAAPVFIQQMALFPTPLSDTDCTTLTTL